jgi:peptidoglycan-N-acetylglucosamine deacetylase
MLVTSNAHAVKKALYIALIMVLGAISSSATACIAKTSPRPVSSLHPQASEDRLRPGPLLTTLVAEDDQAPAQPIYQGRSDTNSVALTFDAGADVGYAPLILDTLKTNGVRATFGMTGQWAQNHPDLVLQMAVDGHEFMNHTWDHKSFTGVSTQTGPLTRSQRWKELDTTQEIVLSITGKSAHPYFRAPFGDQDNSVEADVGLRGYRYDILWSVDTGGWNRASVGQIIAKCERGAKPGAIIVMHVGAESQDGPALQSVIDAIRGKGLEFVTIPELVDGP